MARLGKLAVLVAVAVLIAGSGASASPISFPLTGNAFSSLGVTGAETAVVASNWTSDTWTGTVYSQVFSLSDGSNLYLYQAKNNGPDILEVLVVKPFWNPNLTSAGYLTSGDPAGFLAGGLAPAGQTYDPAVQNFSFQYPSFLGAQVPPGGNTVALYVISPDPWTLGSAYVIDGGAAMGAWVSVPEPMTLFLLAAGGAGILLRRRRR